jgi:hypothetical protein
MKIAIGHSNNPIASGAIQEVLTPCQDSLHGRPPSLGILFISSMGIDFQALLDRILAAYPCLPLVGYTTNAEISNTFPCIEDYLCLLLIHTQNISFSIGLGDNLSSDPVAAANAAWIEALNAGQSTGRNRFSPRLGLVLAEGLKTFRVSVD